jgi:hypothetical protein
MNKRVFLAPDQFKQVELASGGVVAVTFRGNLLTLSEADLKFVLWLVAQLDGYQPQASEQVAIGGDDGEQ